MSRFSRAAVSVASFLCLLGAATVSVPSFASEAPAAPASTATAILAAVTGSLVAVDANTLEHRGADFSTLGNAIPADPATPPTTPSAEQPADVKAVDAAPVIPPKDLAALVADHRDDAASDEDINCLATSVYFESKGEPLNGQLAVAQTIINRSHSGRFPSSVCGVVRQPGQFSFLRKGEMPAAPKASDAWHKAVAIAMIAQRGLWKQIAPAALYFHARRVSPGWGKIKVASLGNHIFFR